MFITTGTVVLVRLHKKTDLLEMKVNGMKDRKVCADKIYDLEKNGGHIQAVGWLLWSGSQTILLLFKDFKICQLQF